MAAAAEVEVVEEARIWIGRAAWPHRRLRKAPNKGSVSLSKLKSGTEHRPSKLEQGTAQSPPNSEREKRRRNGTKEPAMIEKRRRRPWSLVRHARKRPRYPRSNFFWLYPLLRRRVSTFKVQLAPAARMCGDVRARVLWVGSIDSQQ